MTSHRANILDYLAKLEAEEDMEILYACESGSRAWGVESTDSDYDVRFIYKRPVRRYLTLDKRADTFEYMSDDHLYDFAGWDIDKALTLAGKSNPGILEWLGSEIVYREEGDFTHNLQTIMEDFSPSALIYHYSSLANRQWKQYWREGEDLTLKKYIYAVRPILAVYWMVDHGHNMPPIFFKDLNASDYMDEVEFNELSELMKNKAQGTEMDTKGRYEALDGFITEGIEVCKGYAAYAPKTKPNQHKLLNLYHSELFP